MKIQFNSIPFNSIPSNSIPSNSKKRKATKTSVFLETSYIVDAILKPNMMPYKYDERTNPRSSRAKKKKTTHTEIDVLVSKIVAEVRALEARGGEQGAENSDYTFLAAVETAAQFNCPVCGNKVRRVRLRSRVFDLYGGVRMAGASGRIG